MTIIFSFFFVLKKYSQLRMYILFHMALRVFVWKNNHLMHNLLPRSKYVSQTFQLISSF